MLNLLLTLTLGGTPFYEPFNKWPLSSEFKYEVVAVNSLELVPSPAASEGVAARFTVKPGQYIAGGERSEIKIDRHDSLDSEAWYTYNLYIPTNYVEGPQSAFQIMGQWHDQPPVGVAWKDYESHLPLLATKYNRNKLTFVYGINNNQGVIASTAIQKGTWVKLTFHIRWSQTSDGFVEIFRDGNRLVKKWGANMYNSSPATFKMGLYRKRGVFWSTNSVFYDNLKIGNTYNEIQ